jgi:pyridoxine kinase
MGAVETGEAILDAVAAVKRANPAARYCCDPVIGDVGRNVFVREGIPEFMREHAVPAADIVTPNHFELGHLTGREAKTLEQVCAAIDAVHESGPGVVLVTSLHTDETPDDCIDLVASDAKGKFRLRTPRLDISVNGAGDAIAALFFAHCLRTGSVVEALCRAGSSIYGLLKSTAEAGSREMLLVAAQDEFVSPSWMFEPEQVA